MSLIAPPTVFESDAPRTFVIGDIHGCYEELERLLQYLVKSCHIQSEDRVVFLGDYIDRGPDSKKVVHHCLAWKELHAETIFLRGNHELMMERSLRGIAGEGELESYYVNGGATTIKNYGVTAGEWEKLPDQHKLFFEKLENYVVTPNYVFVHAGLNPLRDLMSQFDEEIFWIREPFIMNLHYFRRLVIFGHTPFEKPMVHLPYKLGIDTGLVFGGKLTCLELPTGIVHEIKRGGKRVRKVKLKLK